MKIRNTHWLTNRTILLHTATDPISQGICFMQKSCGKWEDEFPQTQIIIINFWQVLYTRVRDQRTMPSKWNNNRQTKQWIFICFSIIRIHSRKKHILRTHTHTHTDTHSIISYIKIIKFQFSMDEKIIYIWNNWCFWKYIIRYFR